MSGGNGGGDAGMALDHMLEYLEGMAQAAEDDAALTASHGSTAGVLVMALQIHCLASFNCPHALLDDELPRNDSKCWFRVIVHGLPTGAAAARPYAVNFRYLAQ